MKLLFRISGNEYKIDRKNGTFDASKTTISIFISHFSAFIKRKFCTKIITKLVQKHNTEKKMMEQHEAIKLFMENSIQTIQFNSNHKKEMPQRKNIGDGQ